MLEQARKRTFNLQEQMRQAGIQKSVFTDESSIAYLAGFWGYLGIEFGRPTMLIVDATDAPVVITPLMESEMVCEMTWVEDIRTWEDMGQRSWGRALGGVLGENPKEIWIEHNHIPAIVRNFLTGKGWDRFVSPMIHNLQIQQSGKDSSMAHRRASVKAYEKFDPVYFCFCNMAQFKLGFDRMFHIRDVTNQARDVQEAAIAAQQAAIAIIKPGILAEDVAAAANEVYQMRGFETGYRTGRSIGVAYLEAPELKTGDKTVLQVGMTFAVDGGISIDGATAGRIGDSIVVTPTGSEYLTNYPREILLSKG